MTALAVLLIVPFCSGRRRQWQRFSLLIGVLTLSTVSIVGCGGTGSSSMRSTETGSPAGSYTVTVTATSATGGIAITHTLPLTVVIQ
jgi:PKD repeat protein